MFRNGKKATSATMLRLRESDDLVVEVIFQPLFYGSFSLASYTLERLQIIFQPHLSNVQKTTCAL